MMFSISWDRMLGEIRGVSLSGDVISVQAHADPVGDARGEAHRRADGLPNGASTALQGPEEPLRSLHVGYLWYVQCWIIDQLRPVLVQSRTRIAYWRALVDGMHRTTEGGVSEG